jgi:DNA modification methylase
MTKKKPFTFGDFIEGCEKISRGESPYVVHSEPDIKSPLSVYYCNFRNYYPDNYPAKFDEELARFLIRTYSKEKDTILDPMGGSGVIPLTAYELGRNGIYQDINPEAHKLFMEKVEPLHYANRDKGNWAGGSVGDSTKYIVSNDMADLIITSPPFGLSIDAAHDKYSEIKEDLGNSKTYEIWRKKMKAVLQQCFEVLKPGGLAIFETRPRSKKGHSYPLNSWIIIDGIEVGFDFFCEYIEIVDTYRMWTFGKPEQRMPMPAHSYLTILRKPENQKLD